jgi:hypothetical protein
MKEIPELVDIVQRAREQVLETVAGWSAEQGAFKPCPEAWSASEVLEHLYAAEFTVLNQLWRGIDGLRASRPLWDGEHANRGRSIEAIAAVFIPAKFKAHPKTEVKVGGPLSFWMGALDACQPMLERLGSALEKVDREAIVFPHFVVGPLDANQWVPFLGLHLDRHRLQIERLRAAEGFPS